MLTDLTTQKNQTGDLLPDKRISITLLRNTNASLTNNSAVIPPDSFSDTTMKTVNTHGARSIWEIDRRLRCPVIGNCLSFPEQKKILKKANISYKELSDFEIHTTLTQGISEESPLSIRVQKFLNNKYRKNITETGTCSEAKFFSLWKKGIAIGEIDGLLWIAVTMISLSETGINRVFGDIHMLILEFSFPVQIGEIKSVFLTRQVIT